MRADESNGVICFAIKDTFHVETTFVPKFPIEMAGMIELGKKIHGVIELGMEQNGKKNWVGLFPTTTAHWKKNFFEKKLDRKIEKYLFYPGN